MFITGEVDETGMVIDFYHLKKEVNKLDHVNLNDLFDFPTTAENLAVYMTKQLFEMGDDKLQSVRVRVWETETAYAEYSISR
jgi:6-pyruvoyltetrahydropterin/6-carboxytetrahydropterin synthase